MQNIATTCFLAALFLSIGCGDPTAPPSQLATIVESQDRIVSENGELQLTRGTLAIRSISLIASDGNVPLLNSVTLDLAVHEQNLPLLAAIPMGEYTGLRIELAPGSGGAETMDVDVQMSATGQSVRVTSRLAMSGEPNFPEGARTIAKDSAVELRVSLQGMFFYLSPISDAVDGHYEVTQENGGNFLSMDLIGMFDLRVLP